MLGLMGIILAMGRQVGIRILIEGEKPLFLGAGTAFCILSIYSALDSVCLLTGDPATSFAFVDTFAHTFLIGALPFGAMGLVLGMHLHMIRS